MVLGDYIAAFVDGELRGVAPTSEIPPIFGNGFGFNRWFYSDVAEGETINFQYYDSASDAVFNLAETIGFESDMIVGSLTGPQVFTYTPGDGGGDTGGGSGILPTVVLLIGQLLLGRLVLKY